MRAITVIDYNMGNLHSVVKALEKVASDFKISVTNDNEEILKSEAIVFPGVGAFGKGMENLIRLGLTEVLKEKINQGIPFLGICLGFQLLFTTSHEHGRYSGLGVIEGEVIRFPQKVKIPHMGWNQVSKIKEDIIFQNIPSDSYFYFVHSYYVKPRDENLIIGETEYGLWFASAIRRGNIYGVQFHPEKSQDIGLKLLNNFVQVVRKNVGQEDNSLSGC